MSDIRALLVEVGGNEQNDIEIVEVELDDVDIDQFLIQAAQKYDSQEATPGNHCSSFCNWAFARDQCNQIGQDDLAIDFHNDHFWSGLEYHSKWIYTFTQFYSKYETILEPSGRNRILFEGNRELHLRNVNIHATIPAGGLVRIEGPLIRKTRELAIMKISMMKIIN